MGKPIKAVAVLAANPALSSILSAVLAGVPALRVRQFDTQAALTAYMRLSPVDLLVCDFDSEDAPAGGLAQALRSDDTLVQRQFQIIALTRDVTLTMKRTSVANGIDEVIVKPMSPRYLVERVVSRLKRAVPQIEAGRYQGPERRGRLPAASIAAMAGYARRGDNIVPLFRN